MRTTKSSARKYATIGGAVGLLDGLALVLSIHSSFSFLTPILLLLALPCFAVPLRLDGARLPSWAAGALTIALLGAAVGRVVHWLRSYIQPVTRPTVRNESNPNSSGGF
jgi:hypothetical protein